MSYDATLTARVEAFRRDPQQQMAVEKVYRVSDTSLEFANAEFQEVARFGQQVQLNNEPFVEVSDYDGYAQSTAQNILGSKQMFNIDKSAKWDVRIFDIDSVQTVDDIKSLVLDSAVNQQARYMTRVRFQAIKDSNAGIGAENELSNGAAPATPTSTLGNEVFTALDQAYQNLIAQGMSAGDLKAAMPASAASALKFSGFIQNNTEGQNALNKKGYIGELNQTRLFSSIDTPKTEADYDAAVNGAVAVGDRVIEIDGCADGAGTPVAVTPMVNDRFTNGGKTYRIVRVSKTATAGNFKVWLDRPAEAAIADNAALVITGYTHEHIVFAAGKPLSSVIQRNFLLKAEENEGDYFATRLKAMTLFGNFMTDEMARKCEIIPVKVRTFTSV